MGLKDRILDFVAKWGSPAMDHPARGGMTGEDAPEDTPDDTPDETDDGSE
jgi:hypothetical protein